MMKRMLLLSGLFLFLMVSNASAQESFLEDGFKVETLKDGTQILLTPFSEFLIFGADRYETPHKGTFTSLEWNSDHTVFTVKTSDGERITFTKRKENVWSCIHWIGDEIQQEVSCVWVGRKLAWSLSEVLSSATNRMLVDDQRVVIPGLYSEPFSFPKDVDYQLVNDGRVMFVWDNRGYNFRQENFLGSFEARYLIVYPSFSKSSDGKENVIWHYLLSAFSSETSSLTDVVNPFIVSILSRECQELGKNRYGEIEIKSTSGRSTIFFHETNQTARLGYLWGGSGGKLYQGTVFVVSEGSVRWRVTITGASYTAVHIK
ncbi:hypothetical protein HYV70_02070 [Candidatus Uhrbacteria bacterium]|nr:hypothetical protein [Candidatus Uhrbacteria bacterium]